MKTTRLFTLWLFIVTAHVECITSLPLYLGCQNGIYMCDAFSEQHVNQFTKIVDTTSSVHGIWHMTDPRKLIYTVKNTGIYKCDMDGSNQETILTDVSNPSGIATNVYTGDIYWGDMGDSKMYKCNIDACTKTEVVSHFTFQLSVSGGRIYWGIFTSPGQVKSAKLDGSDERIEINNLVQPTGVTVDREERKLYVGELEHRIIRKDLDGGEETILNEYTGSKYNYDLQNVIISNDTLLFSEWQSGAIWAIPKNANGPVDAVEVISSGLDDCSIPIALYFPQEDPGFTKSQPTTAPRQTTTVGQTTHVTTEQETTKNPTTKVKTTSTEPTTDTTTVEPTTDTTIIEEKSSTKSDSSADPTTETENVGASEHPAANTAASSPDPAAATNRCPTTTTHCRFANPNTDISSCSCTCSCSCM